MHLIRFQNYISSDVGGPAAPGRIKQKKAELTLLPAGVGTKKSMRPRSLKLNEITKPLDVEEKQNMMVGALRRILTGERTAVMGGVPKVRNKIITTLAAQSNPR